jgi:3-deoxy-7-phosphoheptulonate synthase
MQSLYPEQFTQLMEEASEIAAVLRRNVPHGIQITETAGATPATAR